MKTVIYEPTEQNLEKCARLIKSGEIVAFPTETVYGLGGNALDETSVKKIYSAKGRPSDNPLIVHIADRNDIYEIAESVPEGAERIIDKFMPGPVTVVLKKKPIVPDSVTGGLGTVAVRMPDSKIAAALIRLSGCPICAPSANTSTKPSPTTATHVYADLKGKIPAIIDGGECSVGVESTVIDFTSAKPRLLRAGGMPLEILEAEVGEIEVVKNSKVALCPGMKYKHYSPLAEVYLAVVGECQAERMARTYDGLVESGVKTVIVAMSGQADNFGSRNVWNAGETESDYAHNLFALLRKADDEKFGAVVCQGTADSGMGASVLNRLTKASGGKTV